MKIGSPLLLALLPLVVHAQTTVWRCGTDYRDRPCSDGHTVAVADPRDAGELRAARDVAARDRALAKELLRERRDAERSAPTGLTGIKPAAAAKAKSAKGPKSAASAPSARAARSSRHSPD